MRINDFTETHCHILPGIDDGSPDVETSLKLVKSLQSQGCSRICATPHYYTDTRPLDDFLQKRNAAYKKLKAALPPGSPEILLGGEVYITRYLFSANENLHRICIGNTDYALIEHPFNEEFGQKACDRLVSLVCDYNIIPILAHIERYKAIMTHEKVLDNLLGIGCIAQVNIQSFAHAGHRVRKKLFKYLEEGKITLIGSDCHNMETRPPVYSEGIDEIEKRCGRRTVQKLIQNANEIFG